MKQKKCEEKKLELNSINCAAAEFFKVLLVNQGIYNGKKSMILKMTFWTKYQSKRAYIITQIEENSNILGGRFSSF